eukprot:15331386-Ditylum_brightwellii.AAC.1
MANPITMQNIQMHQFQDVPLNHLRQSQPAKFPVKIIENRPLICYREHINDPVGLWNIALPTALVQPVIRWYHQVLGHCGINRLYDTIRDRFKAPGLRKLCEEFQCADCQKNRQLGAGYGVLPPRQAALMPWAE